MQQGVADEAAEREAPRRGRLERKQLAGRDQARGHEVTELEDSSEETDGASGSTPLEPEVCGSGRHCRQNIAAGHRRHGSGPNGRKRVYEDAFVPTETPGQAKTVNAAAAVAAAAVAAADIHENEAKWLRAEISQLEGQVETLKEELSQVKAELVECQTDAYSAKLAIKRYKARQRKAQEEVAPAVETASKAMAAAAARAQEVEALKAKLALKDTELGNRVQQIKILVDQNSVQMTELARAKAVILQREREILATRQTVETLMKELQQQRQANAGPSVAPQGQEGAQRQQQRPATQSPNQAQQQQQPNTWAYRAQQQQQREGKQHRYHQHYTGQQQYSHPFPGHSGCAYTHAQHQSPRQTEAEAGPPPPDASRPQPGAAPPPAPDKTSEREPAVAPPASMAPSPLGHFPDLVAEPPALASTSSVAALKTYLLQAGVSELQMSGMEKQEILELAQRKGGAWEIRRLLACAAAASAVPNGQHAAFAAAFRYQATQASVQALYKELKVKVHPDKNHGDTAATPAFQFLQQAYNEYQPLLPA